MKHIVLVLHFYQPPTQTLATTQAILETCYLPLLRMLTTKKNIGITLNLSGSLLEQLEQLKATEFFELTNQLLDSGKIELVNSAMYHSLLPVTPTFVWTRQVQRNKEILSRLFHQTKLAGFFPPELAVDESHLAQLDSKYVILHESALHRTSIAQFNKTTLLVGNKDLIEICRSYPGLLQAKPFVSYLLNTFPKDELIILPNDAELFGHHYVERLQFLDELLDNPELTFITGSKAVSLFAKEAESIEQINISSWQNVNRLELWNEKPLQKKYLEFAELCANLTKQSTDPKVMQYLDQGWSSCYLYWLSNWPWWHPDLVSGGAECLMRSVRAADLPFQTKIEAENMYSSLLNSIWKFHWSKQVEEGYHHYDERRETVLASLPQLS